MKYNCYNGGHMDHFKLREQYDDIISVFEKSRNDITKVVSRSANAYKTEFYKATDLVKAVVLVHNKYGWTLYDETH